MASEDGTLNCSTTQAHSISLFTLLPHQALYSYSSSGVFFPPFRSPFTKRARRRGAKAQRHHHGGGSVYTRERFAHLGPDVQGSKKTESRGNSIVRGVSGGGGRFYFGVTPCAAHSQTSSPSLHTTGVPSRDGGVGGPVRDDSCHGLLGRAINGRQGLTQLGKDCKGVAGSVNGE